MSTKYLNLYVDTDKNPRNSLVRSISNSTPKQIDPFVYGDTINTNVIFITNNVIDETVSNADTEVTTQIGDYGQSILCNGNNYLFSASYGFTGSIGVNTTELSQSLGTSKFINTVFAVKTLNLVTGEYKTYLTTPLVIWNGVGTGQPTPAGSYYTISESNARYVTTTDLANSTSSITAGNGIVKTAGNTVHVGQSVSYTPTGALLYASSATQISMSSNMKYVDSALQLSMSRVLLTGSLHISGAVSASNGIFTRLTASYLQVINTVSASHALRSDRSDALYADLIYNRTGSVMIQKFDNEIEFGSYALNATSSFGDLIQIKGNTNPTASNPSVTWRNKNAVETGMGLTHYKSAGNEFVLKIDTVPTGSSGGRLYVNVPTHFAQVVTGSTINASYFNGGNRFNKIGVGMDTISNGLLTLQTGSAAVAPLVFTPQSIDCVTGSVSIGSTWVNENGETRTTWGGGDLVSIGPCSVGTVPLTIFKQTGTVSRNGSTAGDQMLLSGQGSLDIPAYVLNTNNCINFKFWGYSTMIGVGRTTQYKFKIGGITMVGTAAVEAQNESNMLITIEGSINVRTAGLSGLLRGQGILSQCHSDIQKIVPAVSTSDVSLDTHIMNSIALTVDIIGGGGSDTITLTNGQITVL
jgi:hypothetical protein